MPIVELTASFCLTAICPPGKKKIDYYDRYACTGFVLEVRASGGRTYHLRYLDPSGRQKQHKIGRYEDITFAKALKRAKELRSQVVLGGSPAETKAAKKAVPTYGELAKQHLAYAQSYQRSYHTAKRTIEIHILPKRGKLLLSDIKQQDVALWLAEKRSEGLAPATVEKIRILFNRSFELARKWDIYHINPVKGVARAKFSNARERFLTPEEAARLRRRLASRTISSSAISLRFSCLPARGKGNYSTPNGSMSISGARRGSSQPARPDHIVTCP